MIACHARTVLAGIHGDDRQRVPTVSMDSRLRGNDRSKRRVITAKRATAAERRVWRERSEGSLPLITLDAGRGRDSAHTRSALRSGGPPGVVANSAPGNDSSRPRVTTAAWHAPMTSERGCLLMREAYNSL